MLSGWYGVVEIKELGGSWLAMHCLQMRSTVTVFAAGC